MQFRKIIVIVFLAFVCTQLSAQLCFNPVSSYSTGTNPISVILADFTGDGTPDLVTANSGWGSSTSSSLTNVSLLVGTGGGNFSSAINFTVGPSPASVVSGDFNSDGKLDIAVSDRVAHNVSILLGTGTGSFSIAATFSVGFGPWSIISIDFNADGKLDLATANGGSNNVSILLGTGTGSFAIAADFSVGSSPMSIISDDFNGDGKPDLATSNLNSSDVSVLLGTGSGGFGVATNFLVGTKPNCIFSADFDGDGKADLVTANRHVQDGFPNSISVLIGTGTGNFATASTFSISSFLSGVTCGDFNGDGKVDLATANGYSNDVSVFLGSGTGSFSSAATFSTGYYPNGYYPHALISADLNLDGKLDLVTADYGSNGASILLSCNSVGIAEVNSIESISIYPNPASETLHFKSGATNKSENVYLEISNALGQIVLKKELFDLKQNLDISGLTHGSYLVTIRHNDGFAHGKFVKVAQ